MALGQTTSLHEGHDGQLSCASAGAPRDCKEGPSSPDTTQYILCSSKSLMALWEGKAQTRMKSALKKPSPAGDLGPEPTAPVQCQRSLLLWCLPSASLAPGPLQLWAPPWPQEDLGFLSKTLLFPSALFLC